MPKLCSKKFLQECDRAANDDSGSSCGSVTGPISDLRNSNKLFSSEQEEKSARARVCEQDCFQMPQFWCNKYKQDARRNWDKFYKKCKDNFFRDRHYFEKEFPELQVVLKMPKPVMLECGCGVGNTVFPLLNAHPNLQAFALDFSDNAISLVKSNTSYAEGRCTAFVCDLFKDQIPEAVSCIDVAFMVFFLSALSPAMMRTAVEKVAHTMNEGAILLFRDYARYDLAQLRFDKKSRVENNLYVRQEGTLAYFFELEEVEELFASCGLVLVRSHYQHRTIQNRRADIEMKRCWLHAVFLKRSGCISDE